MMLIIFPQGSDAKMHPRSLILVVVVTLLMGETYVGVHGYVYAASGLKIIKNRSTITRQIHVKFNSDRAITERRINFCSDDSYSDVTRKIETEINDFNLGRGGLRPRFFVHSIYQVLERKKVIIGVNCKKAGKLILNKDTLQLEVKGYITKGRSNTWR